MNCKKCGIFCEKTFCLICFKIIMEKKRLKDIEKNYNESMIN